jgi:hypothetical protein
MKNHQSKTSSASRKHPEKNSKPQLLVDLQSKKPGEVGGPKGPEPTRYGDWEKAGRCSDF